MKSTQWIFLYTLIRFVISPTRGNNEMRPPSFIHEPPSKLIFSNETGSQVSCLAQGSPSPIVSWVHKDGSSVSNIPGLRRTSSNGTLYFPPFLAQYFRPDVHEATYRCKVTNEVGSILSRDVHIVAVVKRQYEVHVENTEVYLGNSALLKCQIPDYVKTYVIVSNWYRGEEILLPDVSDLGERYIVLSSSGDLYIRSIRTEDAHVKYSCLTIDTLGGHRRRSNFVSLTLKENNQNMAPRTTQKPLMELYGDRGSNIHLPCNIQGNPLPVFTWYRVSGSGALYPVSSSPRILLSHTLLLIKNADERDTGKWICQASNQFGEQRIEIRLVVSSFVSVHILPQVQIVNSGGTAIFNCSTTGTTIDGIEWLHNGKPVIEDNGLTTTRNNVQLLSASSMIIKNVSRQDKGIYQCLLNNQRTSAQAMAELKLGDTLPELLYTFIEQNLRPGPQISLKCSARATPPPQFSWKLDSQPILDVSSLHRFAIGQFVDISGDVISHLNISHIRPDDGGLYRCTASNSMGSVSHAARLNVYGPPYVRAIGPIKGVAGKDITIHCPFSGYPIENIRWEKTHQEITSNTHYEVSNVQRGGSLQIKNVDSDRDSGIYTCIVRSRNGEEARRDIQLLVNSPPVIEPFKFPKNLQEGGRAQITCAVSSGDMPVFFSWRKDNMPLPISLQITEKKEEFFSLLVFKDINSKHSGEYTCYASNSAAKINYTAELQVRVSPRWKSEPIDTDVMLGTTISIDCEAEGYPPPVITWFKGKDKTSKDFKKLTMKNKSLIVNLATDNDEGFYMCQATNDIGNGLNKVIHISVNEPARFEQTAQNISSRRGDPVTLGCHAKGDEPISVTWTQNNVRVDLNNYRLSIAEMKSEKGVDSQLSISRSDRHDSGIYKCLAENSYGKSEQTIFLAVQERPDTPSNLEVFEVHSRSVKLSWRRPFDGNSPVLSYFVQYQPLKYLQNPTISVVGININWNAHYVVNRTLPSTSITKSFENNIREQAIVPGLNPDTTYLLRMQAINEIEKSLWTDPIVLKTQEEAPTEAPSNVQVQTGKQRELIVTWQIPPRESWNGELIGYTVNCSEEKQNINYISTTNSSIRSVTVNGWATTKATLQNLRKYTRYAISVRALNSFGPGPWSSQILGTTLEGVPEAPPQNVTCISLSSQSLKISWQEPPLNFHGGNIQGYKIFYQPIINKIDFLSKMEIKRTSNLETYIHTLQKATNYSIRTLAYTSSGDGVSSRTIFCTTDDDVPDAPANIKAVALTADSILIAWLPPLNRNGLITYYTVYMREGGRKGQPKANIVRVDESGYPVTFEARGLIENQIYEFWVSASTSIGEGEPTPVIAQTTNTRAPARIASFSQIVRKAVGSSLVLECLAVGNPTPRARWVTRGRPVTFSPFYEVTTDGNLKIHNVESSLSGNYTCTANNLFGNDEIIYQLIALKPPSPPQIIIQYASSDSIRISWDSPDDGGAQLQGYILEYHIAGETWSKIELTPDTNAYTISKLKCGSQYTIKMSAYNLVGDGQPCEEINVWTKGKVSQAPDEAEFIVANSSCVNLKLSMWNNGGCPINHFSVEHRPLGTIRWTVVTSDISNAEENRKSLIFCDFQPSKWYQLKISAITDAGKTTTQFHFATTDLDGSTMPPPSTFQSEDDLINNNTISVPLQQDWFSTVIVGIIITIVLLLIGLIIKHRKTLCAPISEGYESRVLPGDYKEENDNRRNQQVYSASPVKTVDKGNDSEMYEISPYATFNVSGERVNSTGPVKAPNRGVLASTLDYTVQFKTFGHPEGDNLNATAYPEMQVPGFGHIKSKSSWHKQKYYNMDDDSTLSRSMTIVAGSSQIPQNHKKTNREIDIRSNGRPKTNHSQDGSESDTSASPSTDFSNMPTYRVPVKSGRETFRPESSTESNNDHSSPVDQRDNITRKISSDFKLGRSRKQQILPKESKSMDLTRTGSNNSLGGEVNLDTGFGFRPPSAFTDSRDLNEAECDRERALDLEVQRAMECNDVAESVNQEELTSLLARYQEKKEQERQEYTIHV